MKTHFLFDFDDTISSSYEFNQDMFYKTFLPHKADINEECVRKVHRESRGTAMDHQFQIVIDEFQLDLDPLQLTAENEAMHVEGFRDIALFKSVHKLFSILKKKGKKISICTNRQYDSLNAIMDHHDLRQYLTHIVSCKDEGHEKPDPQCILDIIKTEGEPRDSFIYFGDSKTDYEFASNARIDFVIVDHYLNGKSFYDMIIKAFL